MRPWTKAAFAGLLASSICLWLLFAHDRNERAERWSELERETGLVAAQCRSRLRGGIQVQRIALQQMASFVENSEEVTEGEFHSYAARTMSMAPLCLRISAVDRNLRIRWVHPASFSESMVGFDVSNHERGFEVVSRAMRTHEAALSEQLKLIIDSRGFLLAVPSFRGETFLGAFVCAIRSEDFFERMVAPEVTARYDEEIADDGTVLFSSTGGRRAAMPLPLAEEDLEVGGRRWHVRLTPRIEVAEARLDTGGAAFWTLGWLVALAAGGAVGAGVRRLDGIANHLHVQKEALEETRQQLDGAKVQLLQAEKLTALGELVAGVAHELNNPLASVLGYSQLMLRDDLSPRVKRRVETVVSETERAAKIVKNLLTFARTHPPEKRHLGLNGIIEKTIDLRSYQLNVSQVRIEKNLAENLPKTMIDFHQIQQVLLNLINNAEQALAENGEGGTIRISTRAVGDRIEARVSDDGPGIPPEIRTRIFEPFFTTKQEGKGTGLGLSLCYGIVREHGGTIRVESPPAGGTEFVIDLPVLGQESPEEARSQSTAASAGAALSILVVDDEPSLVSFLVEALTALGHTVDTASDVPEALRKTAESDHDLVICDVKMPHGSGKDVYEAVNARDPAAARRIVFSSGDGHSPEIVEFLRQTRSRMLHKPYRIEEIEKIVAEAAPRRSAPNHGVASDPRRH